MKNRVRSCQPSDSHQILKPLRGPGLVGGEGAEEAVGGTVVGDITTSRMLLLVPPIVRAGPLARQRRRGVIWDAPRRVLPSPVVMGLLPRLEGRAPAWATSERAAQRPSLWAVQSPSEWRSGRTGTSTKPTSRLGRAHRPSRASRRHSSHPATRARAGAAALPGPPGPLLLGHQTAKVAR